MNSGAGGTRNESDRVTPYRAGDRAPVLGIRMGGGLLMALLFGFGLLTARSAYAQGVPELSALSFMAGEWCSSAEGGGTVIEERYTSPSANLILGTTRYLRDGATLSSEFTRIERRADAVVLTAMPSGQQAVEFPMVEVSEDRAVFANPEHDFPRRITYRRSADGETLTAQIEGSGGREASWSMRPCPGELVTSLAFRVYRMEAMEAFYSEAFGARFHDVDLGGLVIREGRIDSVRLRLVPIREAVDFEGFAVHQPGFTVADVERVIRLAEAHGGRLEGEPVVVDGVVVRAAIRDPDGNTVELERRGS